jgi:hypothetical protein
MEMFINSPLRILGARRGGKRFQYAATVFDCEAVSGLWPEIRGLG